MGDKEIQEMFREKNREIIRNNLKLDVERNIDTFTDSLTNIFNGNFDLAIKNIIAVYEDSLYLDSSKQVISFLNKLKLISFNMVNEGILEKKKVLFDKIDELKFEDDLDDYYNLVFDTTNLVIAVFNSDEFKNEKNAIVEEINKFTDYSLNDNSVEIAKTRISDYINIRLFGKIEEKVNDEFKIRDNNLCNKGKESYERFQDISNVTANI